MSGLGTLYSFTPTSFDDCFSKIVAQYNNGATIPADTTQGSTLWSIMKSVALMFAEQSLQIVGPGGVVEIARLASCNGPDVDSYCGQFNIPRLGAVAATGSVTVGVKSPLSSQAVLYVGQVIGSNIGSNTVTVIADPTNPAYSEALDGYVAAPETSSTTATVRSNSTGYASNVQQGELTLFLGSVEGVAVQFTSVTNPLAFTNGKDQESDAAYKSRFVTEVVGGGSGTSLSCAAQAVLADTDLTFAIGDPWNNAASAATPAYFTIVVGTVNSGVAITPSVLALATSNALATRPGGSYMTVIGATVVPVAVNVTVKIDPSYDLGLTQTALTSAIQNYLNSIVLAGQSMNPTFASFGRIYAAIFSVPGAIDASGMTVNGAAPSDVQAPFGSQIVAGAITVTTTY